MTPSYARPKEPVIPAYFEQVAADLDRLLPPDFLEACPIDRIVRLPRQLEALKFRLARARLDPEKDRAKAAQVEPWEYTLARLEEEVSAGGAAPNSGTQYSVPHSSQARGAGANEGQSIVSPDKEKRRAVEELRRMVEEFKISLFAPEIKTAFPISAIRLARKVKEIEELA